jgi:FkbM family methyltransferase
MLPQVNIIKCKEANYLLFNTNDLISRTLYNSGQWQEYLIIISKFFVKGVDKPLIIDIGANLGAYSIPLAKSIQAVEGAVIGFEPQRTVFYQLCGNVVLNQLDNYVAHNSAVGEKNCMIEIPVLSYEKHHNIGAFSLEREFRVAKGIEQYTSYEKFTPATMIMLDSLQTPKSPSLIKIDVEGYELNVLKGGVKFLEEHSYPPLLFEAWSAAWFAEHKKDLFKFIAELGYTISLTIGEEYVAQHPKHPVNVEFQKHDDGRVNMVRTR